MTGIALGLLLGAMLVAAIDWFAVVRQNKVVEYVCKPSAALLFLLAAAALDPVDGPARTWLLVALGLCILGDTFLMLPRDAFVPGLASFAVAQVLLVISFSVREVSSERLTLGVVVVIASSGILARRFISALRHGGHSSLIAPIVVYMMVISAMVATSIAAGSAISIVGAILFMASDSLIAEERFVRHRRWQPFTIIVTYHLALAGLVLGLV